MINIQGLKAKISEKGVVKGTANNKIVYEKLENIEELIDDINNEVVEGSAVDKLNYLDDTKDQIKEAIKNKGVEVEDTDTFRNYAERIDEIPQDKFLDVGGKNPVLVKEYHEVIPFTDAEYSKITPTTSLQTMYARKKVLEEYLDTDNYDYVIVCISLIKVKNNADIPYSSNFEKNAAIINSNNFGKMQSRTIGKQDNEMFQLYNDRYMYYKAKNTNANTFTLFKGAHGGFAHADMFSISSNNNKITIQSPKIGINIDNRGMSADSFQYVDVNESSINYNIKIYRVDKWTAPTIVLNSKVVNSVINGMI